MNEIGRLGWFLMRAAGRVAVILAVVCVTHPSAAFMPHSDEEIVRNFDIVAFNSEFRKVEDKRVRKWVAPIRIFLDIRIEHGAVFRWLTKRTVAQLAKASGHDIRLIDERKDANVIGTIDVRDRLPVTAKEYFPGDAAMQRLITSNLCVGRYYANEQSEIFRAHVFIPSDWTLAHGLASHCVAEEFTQVLGLPNDSDEVRLSLFNDKSVVDRLNEHDLTLVKLLYDPRITPGMPREKALRVARRILPEIRR